MVSRSYEVKQKRMAQGLCRDCGKTHLLIPGKVICEDCFEKRKAQQKITYARKAASGKCFRCGGNPSQPGTNLCVECREKQIDYYRNKRKSAKIRIYEHFGSKCNHCAETDIRCMTVDHVNNDAATDSLVYRKSDGSRYNSTGWYEKILAQIQKGEQGSELQMLCFNCHAKKDLAPWWHEEKEQ